MKKRVLSMILMVCMIVSLLVGFTVSAAAEAGIVTYTLKEGDTVLKACQKNGIDFYAKQKLIATINNITDYRSLPVGFTVKLPTDAYVASASTAAAASAASAGSSTAAVSGAATTANIAVGDTVSYYLIKYQMKSGDTVAGVCNSLGVNFGTYSSMIKDINGIGNWNNVKAGSTILIPSATTPPVGTSCYAVVAHTVASGETATSICASYGMNYGANEALLKAINNKSNLNSIMRGSSFLVPVSTTIKGSGTVPSGSGSSSSGSSSSTEKVNSNSTTYSITGEITNSNCNGFVAWEFLLNGKSVTKAAAGETITIKHVNSNKNYFVGYITVVDNSGNMQIITDKTPRTFVMPASPVKVYFNMQSYNLYDLEVVASSGGKIECYVDGVQATRAREGQVVTVIASADSGFEMQRLSWSESKSFATSNVIKDNGTFVMPAAKTYVKADFTKAAAHTIYDLTPSSAGGSIKFEVGGKKTTNAWGGYTVHVIATPKDGYVLDSIKVCQHNNVLYTIAVNKSDCTFEMPGFDVDVLATFKQVKHLIKTSPQFVTGTVVYKVGSVVVKEAGKGDTVTAEVTPSSGYQVKKMYYQYTDSNDNIATADITVSGNTGTFTMPGTDVCVFAEFEKIPVTYSIKVCYIKDGTQITFPVGSTYNGVKYNGITKTTANVGDLITLKAELNDSFNNSAYYILENDVNKGAHHAIPFNSSFDMPADNITVCVESTPKAYTVNSGSISNGSIVFTDSNEENNSSITSDRDETVTIKINPNSDFEYIPGSIVIKNQYDYDLVAGGEITPDTSKLASERVITFKMPASSVTVSVKYRRQIHELPDLISTNFEYRVMIDGNLVKLNDAAVVAKFKDDKYSTADYGAGNGKFYYDMTIFVYYTGGAFDKDAHTLKAWDKVGNPYNPANGININETGYYFGFNANMVKPAKIEVS